ncbi:hypothetical protein MYK68_04895 [Gordonia sp. PP30]|uniref:hypothetical protein n=1 Tax=Gordonia sp. PP30 TaxID=2935861 RepID=UPI002000128E|nr:hypothetical protein [Gordonia sp. PP30]UQE75940.1 hypothetical protein MYK68_04895 [Gordonia sp. PP30]
MTEFWEARPVLRHVRNYARAEGAGPRAVLAGVLGNVIASTDPDIQLPGGGSLNLCIAYVGASGAGKGRAERAAQGAVRLVHGDDVQRWSVGSGEGLATLFAVSRDGEQECRRAVIDVHEVDGLAALAKRQGATIMATIRQVWSGEPIGQLNAAARRYAPAHSYRAVFSVGVQPERAEALLGDRAGTAQRFLWVPVSDPDAPRHRPPLPAPVTIDVNGIGGTIEIPDIAREALDEHRWHVLTESGEVDPLDGHALFSRLKVAAGFMLLDERTAAINAEDWELAGALMRQSARTRARIQNTISETMRRSNRAKAHAAAERDEVIGDRKLERAKSAVLRWIEKHGQQTEGALSRRARSDWRSDVPAAIEALIDDQAIVKVADDSYALRVHVDPRSTSDNASSEYVDSGSTWTPPGGLKPDSPGQAERVATALANAQKDTQ